MGFALLDMAETVVWHLLMRQKIHSAWMILLIGLPLVVSLYITGTLMNVYLGVMAEDMSVSRSALSVNGTIRYIVAFGLNLCIAPFIRKIGLKKLILLGLISSGIMFCLFSTAQSIWMCYVAGAIGGLGSCFAGVAPVALLVRMWFPRTQGTALAITSSMTGLAGVIFTPMFSGLVNECGWRVGFRYLVVFIAVAFVLECIFLQIPEKGREAEKESTDTDKKKVEAEDVRSKQENTKIWMLIAINSLFSLGALCVYSNTAVILIDIGFSQIFATGLAISMICFSNIMGKFIMGRLCDRRNMWKVLIAWYILCIGAALYFVFFRFTNIMVAVPGIVLIGFIGGIYSLPVPLMTGKLFTASKTYTQVIGYCTAAANLSTAFAGFIFHKFYDISGTYLYAMIYVAVLAVLCAFLVWSLIRSKDK